METICFSSNEKLYLQIYDYFVREIEGKRIQSGDKLPASRKLADHLGVSLNTVKAAYDMLLEEGYIVAKERSGYYVDKILSEHFPRLDEKIEIFQPPDLKSYRYNFKYSLTDPSKLPLTVIKKCTQEAVHQALETGDHPREGAWELRQEIAKYLKARRGVQTSPQNILVTSGFADHLFLLSALLPQALFALENPGYTRLSFILQSLGQKHLYVPIDQYGFSVKDLERTAANVVITSPNHQFPTGLITGIRRRQRLLNWAQEQPGRYIVEDDYNSDFKYTGRPIPALKSMDESDCVILSGSFSQSIGKFLGISYLVLPDQLLHQATALQLPLQQVSPFLQYTLKEFLARGDFEKHLNRMNTLYSRKRKKFLKALKQADYADHIDLAGSEAGLHIIAKLDSDYFDLENLEDRMADQEVYVERVKKYAQGLWPENEIILGFGGIREDQLEEAVDFLLQNLRK
ncbi:MAG: PLP-dependent aminotransferase family protein [Eubacteriales bacterium]|nr:PLP-dependent aminotransferase family protein [Clostridiales bacterium]MDY5836747.1 PLP-dependent aminotransferase family protein [Eubacteriales bacterium]